MSQRHYGLTRAIIGCAFQVSNELGAGFLESVYEKAMLVALKDEGIAAVSQKPIEVTFRGQTVVLSWRICWLRTRSSLSSRQQKPSLRNIKLKQSTI